ncbi:MAG: hypothetical protein CMN76_10785 [Spirochaetaceae bacterium]|nr:hypothetical protein [Spirochaetaceae bacterium]
MEPQFAEMNSAVDNYTLVEIFSQVVPFPFVFAMIIGHAIPVFRQTGPAHLYPETIKRRLINSPMLLSLFGSSGWIMGYIFFQISAFLRGHRLP